MPLQLGSIRHQRSQLVTWDPNVYEQTVESRQRIDELITQGFTIKVEEVGEVVLIPPPKKDYEGLFRILCDKGDDIIVWDRRNVNQVKEAFTKFKEFIDKGHTAYATHSDGKRAHKIDTFDPGLEEIIMVPKTRPG